MGEKIEVSAVHIYDKTTGRRITTLSGPITIELGERTDHDMPKHDLDKGGCWLIRFRDGHAIIVSEKLYEYERLNHWAAWGGHQKICSAEYWPDVNECRRMRRGIRYYE